MKLTPRYADAFSFARELHENQVRKGTEIPYLAHLMAVSAIVLEHGGSEDEAIAALLHDAVEDQGGHDTLVEIVRRFGETVGMIVDGCTDTDVVPKPPWRERKERYVAHVKKTPRAVRLVSAADKLHNARSILTDYRTQGDALWSRFSGGKDGSLWYYRALTTAYADAAGDPTPAALLRELDRVVTELETLSRKS
ncbi:MAG: HD domain-containing protein [Deltaproteobacteria bacterium]|nr:HD domain-containing protein [Deltaproteobacteria bacterium]